MSPLSLRRHRAERLLREEFEGLRERVLASVRGRLRANGASLDQDDLEACYATAWQGLYAAVLDGQEIANPTGWLVLVTFRRAIEEQRDRARVRCGSELTHAGSGELQSERSSAPYGLAALTETAGRPRRTSPPRSTTACACASCSRDCAVGSTVASARPQRSAICRAFRARRQPREWA